MKATDLSDLNLPEYQIQQELGRNREGGRITWQATELATNKTVVIKQFCFATVNSSWSGYRAYQQEIELLQKLQHPGIPRYLDSLETPNGFCLIQEYIAAPDLSNAKFFTLDEIKLIAQKLLEILVYLQQQQPPIFHRDLKPENILVDDELKVYLIDFGLARLGEGTTSVSSIFAGTPGFIAPEQILAPTKASDLYSLGVTLICLLTQKNTNDIQSAISEENPYKLEFKSLLPPLNRQFVAWLDNMVQPQANKRFRDAATALKALESIDPHPQEGKIVIGQNLAANLPQSFDRSLILGTGAVGILSVIAAVSIDFVTNNLKLTNIELIVSLIGLIVTTLAELTAATVARSEPQAKKEAIILAISIPILLVFVVSLILGRSGAIAMTAAIILSQIYSLSYSLLKQSYLGLNYPKSTLIALLSSIAMGIAIGYLI
jgi:serine/threonine protein kinase